MTFRRFALLSIVIAMAALLAACGSSSSPQLPISVAFSSAPPTSMVVSTTATIAATVSNDTKNGGVKWTVTCGSADCGSFNPTSTASGASTVYTAPATIPSGNTVTVTATSVTDPTKSVSAPITITASAPISVAFTAGSTPPTSMAINTTASIAATVTSDPANAGVNWTVTCGSADCGSFNPTATASGVATTYTAPASVPTGNTVTVTATSVTDNTKSVSANITITAPVPITVTFNPAARAVMNVNSTSPFTATVANDPANAGVTWSVACTPAGNGSIGLCGGFSLSSTDSGSPTVYTAPSGVPSGGTVTITATSVSDNTATASATVIVEQRPTTLADGTYVFQLSGWDNNLASPYYISGAFSISGGAITGGEQDVVDFFDVENDSIDAGSSVVATDDGNLQITLVTGFNPDEILNVTLVSSSRGLISEFDPFGTATGTIDLQTSIAAPSGSYAFFVSGVDAGFSNVAIGGVLNVDNIGTGSGSVFDINDAGLVEQNQLFGPSLSFSPDSFGRVEFDLIPTFASGVQEITLIGYIVDANTIRFVESDDDFFGTMGGTALSQGSKTGGFGNSDLSGTSYVIGAQGADVNSPYLDVAGAFNFSATDNTVSGNAAFNDLTSSVGGGFTGTYAVASTGRVTVSGITGGGYSGGILQLYLDGNGNALAVSMDPTDVVAGPAYQQTAGASFLGDYALGGIGVTVDANQDLGFGFWSSVGPVDVADDGTLTGFTDFNYLATNQTANVQLYGSATGSTNLLTGAITGQNALSSATQDTFTYYVIDDLRAFGIETDLSQIGLGYFEQPAMARKPKTHK